ncbi:unnamed protein product [Symbiodinium microadriaticum]|nr:unnamed protein product [Symbiodinium microadriaticum]
MVQSMIQFGIPKLLILMWNREIPITPKYDALDLFSGKGLVKEALCGLGMATAAHDLENHPSMDVNKSAGFGLILMSFLCLKPDGPRHVGVGNTCVSSFSKPICVYTLYTPCI